MAKRPALPAPAFGFIREGIVREEKEVARLFTRDFAKTPEGFKVLIFYSLLVMLSYIVFAFIVPKGVILNLPSGGYIMFSNVVVFVATLFVVFGFIERKGWSYPLAVGLYLYSILNSILLMLLIDDSLLSYVSDILMASLLFIVVINGLTLWYVHDKRHYLMSPARLRFDMVDKVFVSGIYLFYFFSIILALTFTIQFITEATGSVDSILDGLRSKDMAASVSFCDAQGEHRDLCLVSVATIHASEKGADLVCQMVGSGIYQFTCYQAVLSA